MMKVFVSKGFGRSSRCTFNSDPALAEFQYVSALEKWREEVGLKKMILLGHSFGGYLSAAYTLRHPDNVQHLILADPWGILEKPADYVQRFVNFVSCFATFYLA